MPSKLCESDGEIAFLVRFVFQMGCAKEVSYRPTSLMCIWMTSAVFLIVVILDVCRGILLLTTCICRRFGVDIPISNWDERITLCV